MDQLRLTYDQFEIYTKEFAAVSSKLKDGWEVRRVQHPKETVYLVKTLSLFLTDHHDHVEEGDNDHTSLEQFLGDQEIEEEDDPAIMNSSGTSASLPATSIQSSTELCQNSPQVNALPLRPAHSPLPVYVEYHIVHSFSYEVPVLYFNATYSNGRQLSLEDTWRLLSNQFVSCDMDRWGLVSQQEHPLLHCPFYHIHPCHTAKVMAQAMKTEKRNQTISDDVHVSSGTEKAKNEGSSDGDSSSRSVDSLNAVDKGQKQLKTLDTDLKGEPNYLISWLSTFGPLLGLKVPLEYTIT